MTSPSLIDKAHPLLAGIQPVALECGRRSYGIGRRNCCDRGQKQQSHWPSNATGNAFGGIASPGHVYSGVQLHRQTVCSETNNNETSARQMIRQLKAKISEARQKFEDCINGKEGVNTRLNADLKKAFGYIPFL